MVSFIPLNNKLKSTKDAKAVMERDFWSTDVPFTTKHKLHSVTMVAKALVGFLISNAIIMTVGQFYFNIYAQWPFISEKMYPYYIVTFILFASGAYVVVYAHCLIFSYHCFHAYCQTLLLNEYFKQIATGFSNLTDHQKVISKDYQVAINSRLPIGIKHHIKLKR